uniref:MPN domain-containing protein n=1 Tax=Clastoptera arizonana TaxID=38151 RepID=A0A1B6DTV1_9HEMI
MYLSAVYMSNDLYMACLQLALSTEKAEVMALLLGEYKEEDDGNVLYILALKIPLRLDKKKDRVEMSPQQLVEATEYASEFSKKCGRELRIVGWYHSHPHITVYPSQIDLGTQMSYQLLDKGFVGVICSVFSENSSNKVCEVNLICFQSKTYKKSDGDDGREIKEVPIHILPDKTPNINCLELICGLPEILLEEELNDYGSMDNTKLDPYSLIQNRLVLAKSISHLIDNLSMPLLKTLKGRNQILTHLHKELTKLKNESNADQNESEG